MFPPSLSTTQARCPLCSPVFSSIVVSLFLFSTGFGQCDYSKGLLNRASVSIATVQAPTGLNQSPPSLRGHSIGALSPMHSSQTPSPLSRVVEQTLIWKILRFLLRPMCMVKQTPGHPVVSISESLRLFSGHTLMARRLGSSGLRHRRI